MCWRSILDLGSVIDLVLGRASGGASVAALCWLNFVYGEFQSARCFGQASCMETLVKRVGLLDVVPSFNQVAAVVLSGMCSLCYHVLDCVFSVGCGDSMTLNELSVISLLW